MRISGYHPLSIIPFWKKRLLNSFVRFWEAFDGSVVTYDGSVVIFDGGLKAFMKDEWHLVESIMEAFERWFWKMIFCANNPIVSPHWGLGVSMKIPIATYDGIIYGRSWRMIPFARVQVILLTPMDSYFYANVPLLSERLWGSPFGCRCSPLLSKRFLKRFLFFEFHHETLLAFDETLLAFDGVILWRDLRNDTLCQSVSDSLTRVWVILWRVCSEFSQIWTPFAPFINSLCPFGFNPPCMDPWPLSWGCPKDASCFDRCLSICQIPSL